MSSEFHQSIQQQLEQLKRLGLYKTERVMLSPQQASVRITSGQTALNFCANNYLGLANHPALIEAAQAALQRHGFGMASVRFICGTNEQHHVLEQKLSQFLGQEDTILYASCFDANTGLFETLFEQQDAIISDALNHASLIDGIRLCKAMRFRYANNDMADLEQQLQAAHNAGSRYRVIVTDGVFSMDGVVANLPDICDLAEQYDALVMVDDSHAVGIMGAHGRGTHEYHHVMSRIDIITGTLGKAMGGASGGYTAGKKPVIDWLRQRSRPYLFSNALPPALVAASIRALALLEESEDLRQRLWANAAHFRKRMYDAGFTLAGADHAIIPIMLGDAQIAHEFAERALAKGVYVVGFTYPVVPKGQARIRTQMSAAHSQAQLDQAIDVLCEVGQEMGLIHM